MKSKPFPFIHSFIPITQNKRSKTAPKRGAGVMGEDTVLVTVDPKSITKTSTDSPFRELREEARAEGAQGQSFCLYNLRKASRKA